MHILIARVRLLFRAAWDAARDSACRMPGTALSMTVLAAPLWLPYALLAGHPKDSAGT